MTGCNVGYKKNGSNHQYKTNFEQQFDKWHRNNPFSNSTFISLVSSSLQTWFSITSSPSTTLLLGQVPSFWGSRTSLIQHLKSTRNLEARFLYTGVHYDLYKIPNKDWNNILFGSVDITIWRGSENTYIYDNGYKMYEVCF
jgi:hypothetical protein